MLLERGPNAHQISIILSVIQMHKIIELLMVSKLMVKVESSSSRCVFLEYKLYKQLLRSNSVCTMLFMFD